MRNQRFGVEIETKELSIARAARVVRDALGAADGGGSCVADPATGKIWKVVRDGSLHGTSAEIVTPILTYEEIPKLQEVVRALFQAGARVDSECGLHVHVDASNHDAASLARLIKLINSKEKLLFKALEVDAARLRKYARGINQVFLSRIVRHTPCDLVELVQGLVSSRYHGVNLQALRKHGTIEFRYFNGTLHAGKVKAYVQLCLALSHKALITRAAGHRPTLTTNDKFTFRVWLVGLGLKGPEFKTARKHLTENLNGSSAWRYNQGGPRRQRAIPRVPRIPEQMESLPNRVRLENRTGNHYKFYHIEWNGGPMVRRTWGRIGTVGQTMEERVDESAIPAYVDMIVRTRIRHDYYVVSDSREE